MPDFAAVNAAALRSGFDLVTAWLPDGQRRGNEWVALNPRRADSAAGSFSINFESGQWADFATGDKGGDLVSLYAYVRGLSQGDACKQLGEELRVTGSEPRRDFRRAGTPAAPAEKRTRVDDGELMRPAPADAPDWRHVLVDARLGRATAHWIYRDVGADILMIVVRWDVAGGDKEIRQFTCWRVNGVLVWRMKWIDKPRPMYGLDRLATREQETVLVCEGEKAADAAAILLPEYVATTTPGGAKNTGAVAWSPLFGRRVIIWPDADEPGRDYAESIVKNGRIAGARSIQTLSQEWITAARELVAEKRDAGLPKGYDAADLLAEAIANGGTPGAISLPPLAFVDRDDVVIFGAGRDTSGAGDERRSRIPSGRHHHELVRRLEAELERRGYLPDAVDGWRCAHTGKLLTVSLGELALDIWFGLLDDQGLSKQHITDVLSAMTHRARAIRRAELLGRLTGKPATQQGREALAAWVHAITGKESPTDVTVMAHWLWLVKRAAVGASFENDIMPIVYSTKQGNGKSTATGRLVAPLEELVTTINAQTLTDERRYRMLGQVLVGRWEEMQGAQRAEIEALKHTITAPTLTYRELNTHSAVTLRRTCSFIGTSNNSVDTMVGDPTGARRFYQVDAQDVIDRSVINAVDPVLIWQAVSEADAAPIDQAIHIVRVAQIELVHRDAVSMWLEAEAWTPLSIRQADQVMDLTIPPYDPEKGQCFEHIAARFRHWCQIVGQSMIGPKELAKRLKQEGWTHNRPDAPRGTPRLRYYKRPAESSKTSDPAVTTASPAGETPRPSRGERMASPPSPDEDVLGDALPL